MLDGQDFVGVKTKRYLRKRPVGKEEGGKDKKNGGRHASAYLGALHG